MFSHVGSLAQFFEETGGLFAHPYSGVPVPTSSPVSFGTNDGAQVTHAPSRRAPQPFPIAGPKTKVPQSPQPWGTIIMQGNTPVDIPVWTKPTPVQMPVHAAPVLKVPPNAPGTGTIGTSRGGAPVAIAPAPTPVAPTRIRPTTPIVKPRFVLGSD